jgi:hypothetical protein
VTEAMRMWVEIAFNITYLLVVWGFVVAMLRRQAALPLEQRSVTRLFILAFGLLALGDTGHVGFRVWAYALDGLDTRFALGGLEIGLVGLGALSTAITVTFFYVLVLFVWRRRFEKSLDWFAYLLMIAALIRLVVMAFPQNEWNSSVPPWTWSMVRNVPLIVQGLGVAYLIIRDARTAQDRVFKWIGAMILVSYAFYTPVILLVQRVPAIGMLMIPKTMAYVAIAWLAFANLFPQKGTN